MQRFSLGMFYGGLIAFFAVKVDSILIAKLLTVELVAAYVIVSKPFLLTQTVVGLLMQALVPAAAVLPAATERAVETKSASVDVVLHLMIFQTPLPKPEPSPLPQSAWVGPKGLIGFVVQTHLSA